NGVPDFFQASTSVEYQPNERCYDFLGVFQGYQKLLAVGEKKLSVDSKVRISREGGLRRVEFKVTRQTVLPQGQLSDPNITTIEGDVVSFGPLGDGQVALRWQNPSEQMDVTSEPAEVALQGMLLNPFQPPSRLPGLHGGRHWRMPMIDPVGDPAHGIQGVEAEVLPQVQAFPFED